MTSERKAESNRRNAQLSTGPTTAEGKALCSGNALRHGFHARQILLPGENRAAWEELLSSLEAELVPAGPHEHYLVFQIASAWWRLLRLARIEYGFLLQLVDVAGKPRSPNWTEYQFLDLYPRSIGLALHADKALKTIVLFNRWQSNLGRAFFRALEDLRGTPNSPEFPENADRLAPFRKNANDGGEE